MGSVQGQQDEHVMEDNHHHSPLMVIIIFLVIFFWGVSYLENMLDYLWQFCVIIGEDALPTY